VRVYIVPEERNAQDKPQQVAATGFFITREGRVLTSLGAVSTRILRVWIEKDGLDYAADYLGGDARTTLALIQIGQRMPDHIEVIPIDPRPTPLPVGAPLLAIAQPFGLDVSPSPGVVTGYESGFAEFVFPCTYMRTNIALGPSEGGAPVLDAEGKLAGVEVADVPQLRASYLVAPNWLQRIVGDLAYSGTVEYGKLPMEFVEDADAPYVTRRIVVSTVEPGGSADRAGVRPGDVVRNLEVQVSKVEPHMAERAGLKPGDVLPTIGLRPFRRIADVRDTLFNARPGDYVRIELEREGRVIPFFTLPVDALPEPAADPSS
jgi:serine protease Do